MPQGEQLPAPAKFIIVRGQKMSRILETLLGSEKKNASKSSLGLRGNEQLGPQLPASPENHPVGFEDVKRVRWPMDSEKRIVAWADPHAIGAEKFRVLRYRLQHLRMARALSKVLVTSAIPREGKTVVATNLAFTLARSSPHVLLVDADLRLSAVHQMLGIPPMAGLTEVLQGKLDARAAIRRLDPSGLYYLPAGHPPPNPVELLQSPGIQELLTQTSSAFDWIVLDAPPVNLFADARHLANFADAVVLVLRVGVTPRESTQQVSTALDGAFIAGVVVNGDVNPLQDRYYYSYYPRHKNA